MYVLCVDSTSEHSKGISEPRRYGLKAKVLRLLVKTAQDCHLLVAKGLDSVILTTRSVLLGHLIAMIRHQLV